MTEYSAFLIRKEKCFHLIACSNTGSRFTFLIASFFFLQTYSLFPIIPVSQTNQKVMILRVSLSIVHAFTDEYQQFSP